MARFSQPAREPPPRALCTARFLVSNFVLGIARVDKCFCEFAHVPLCVGPFRAEVFRELEGSLVQRAYDPFVARLLDRSEVVAPHLVPRKQQPRAPPGHVRGLPDAAAHPSQPPAETGYPSRYGRIDPGSPGPPP